MNSMDQLLTALAAVDTLRNRGANYASIRLAQSVIDFYAERVRVNVMEHFLGARIFFAIPKTEVR